MKSRSVTKFGYVLFAVFLGSSILAAQEIQKFEVPVPPPPDGDEDVLMFWNDADMDDDDGPEMAWFGEGPDVVGIAPGPEIGTGPMHHYTAGRRVLMHGENRPWLGVMLSDIDTDQAQGAKASSLNGVLVKEVRPESPAAKAGLAKDDVITEFAGEKVRSAEQLRRLVRETPTGRSVPIVVNRAGKSQSLTAKLEARHAGPVAMGGEAGPGEFNMAIPAPGHPMPGGEFTVPIPGPGREGGRNFKFFVQRGARLGISGDDLTPQLAEFFGVKQGKGVLVREVIVGSAAEKAGLKAGDVIVAVDGQEVPGVGKLRRALAGDKPEAADKRKVSLTIVRDKREQTLSVELDSPDKGMPKPAMRAEIEVDTDRAIELADEAAARAKEISLEWRERAKTFQTEWQVRLQEEMKRLHEQLPRIQEEVERARASARAALETI